MKILYIASMRLPTERAHGTQIMHMCEAFAELGHEVTLLVPDRKTDINADPYEYWAVQKNFSIEKVSATDTVSWGRLGFWLYQITFGRSCAKYLKDKDFDVVFSRDEVPLSFLVGNTKAKLVWESHMGRFNAIVKKLIESKVKLVMISNGLRDWYALNGVPKDEMIVVHDGITPEDFDTKVTQEVARKNLDLPLDKKIVMYIGSLEEWKGYRTLLESSRQLPDDILVAIIGGKPDQIAGLQQEYPAVRFLGYRQYTELPAHQRAADVLIVPNTAGSDLSARFTSPLKVFAHMASGVPILASDLPSIREVLNDENAYFFEPDNVDDLAEKIQQVFETSDTKAAQALNDVEEYTWQARAESILSILYSQK